MALAITDDHRTLAEVARSALSGQRAAARALLEAEEGLPGIWKEQASLGWLGLHVPEEFGGEGAGLPAVLDPTRRGGRVRVDDAPVLGVIAGGAALARRLTRVLAAAEAAGSATACLEVSVAYVKERRQFGRTVGTFQAVKHHCANLLLDAELAVAAAWDASRAPAGTPGAELAAAVAAARSVPAAVRAAEMTIQLHGGIGFTWEHDAHLYLRRALTLAAIVAQTGDPERDVARLTREGVERAPDLDLPPEAEGHRAAAREFVASLDGLDAAGRRAAMVESGYLVPHWPPPWGRDASATEQLVIEQEFRGVDVPSLGITAWNIQTISQHGTPEQWERWLGPALLGETEWCQLFSEPGAGSDAAAISTRGVRVDGGWRVTGQKVWTTRAHESHWGFATVRTDAVSATGSKHAGITMMAIDLGADGVDVRPLRELTGDALFNEVFLDAVFVPDSDVVGEVGQGWRVARATLGNERVSIGGGGAGRLPLRAWDLLPLAAAAPDPHTAEREVGALIADELATRLLILRQAARAVGGTEPGPEGNLNKLFTSEHAQRVAGLAVRLAGTEAVSGGNDLVMRCYLWSRCLTIAGGTSEIARNQVAERLLGLPRDPLIL
ncbi:acyl-CoA dehydrogenase family protein [Pseudonocardia sp.]|uniref:acyl-CoA dehydrogenase family protein n=1 Tax=Pseudonocardia sp. TaxID=60912 RepID=UPI0026080469|nr:acyl-CoA dehydrogenase family protein [Pseudonocardia sp.]